MLAFPRTSRSASSESADCDLVPRALELILLAQAIHQTSWQVTTMQEVKNVVGQRQERPRVTASPGTPHTFSIPTITPAAHEELMHGVEPLEDLVTLVRRPLDLLIVPLLAKGPLDLMHDELVKCLSRWPRVQATSDRSESVALPADRGHRGAVGGACPPDRAVDTSRPGISRRPLPAAGRRHCTGETTVLELFPAATRTGGVATNLSLGHVRRILPLDLLNGNQVGRRNPSKRRWSFQRMWLLCGFPLGQ